MHWYGHYKGRGPEPRAPRGKARRAQEHDLRTAGFRKAFFGLGTYEYPRACGREQSYVSCGVCHGRGWEMYEGQCFTCGSY